MCCCWQQCCPASKILKSRSGPFLRISRPPALRLSTPIAIGRGRPWCGGLPFPLGTRGGATTPCRVISILAVWPIALVLSVAFLRVLAMSQLLPNVTSRREPDLGWQGVILFIFRSLTTCLDHYGSSFGQNKSICWKISSHWVSMTGLSNFCYSSSGFPL